MTEKHAQKAVSCLKYRPNIRVDLCFPQMPELSAIHLNKPSDILCADKPHIKPKGCGGRCPEKDVCFGSNLRRWL
jgi:hypothetical protein